MRNAEIAAAFDELGDLYELDGAVVYRELPLCPMCGGTVWESRGSLAQRPLD